MMTERSHFDEVVTPLTDLLRLLLDLPTEEATDIIAQAIVEAEGVSDRLARPAS
jgi:hypothetical protein